MDATIKRRLPEPKPALLKKLDYVAVGLSIVVLLLVGAMRQVKLPVEADLSMLPGLHAILNSLAALALIVALYFVKTKQYVKHQYAIYVAIGLSVLFLLSYVAYHFTTEETLYGDIDGDGVLSATESAAVAGTRFWYLMLLGSHIILAAVSFPFILFTFNRAYTGQFARHKKLARWVYPVWLYVAITGPICYLMLAEYYQ